MRRLNMDPPLIFKFFFLYQESKKIGCWFFLVVFRLPRVVVERQTRDALLLLLLLLFNIQDGLCALRAVLLLLLKPQQPETH